jgi:hypothetical protein
MSLRVYASGGQVLKKIGAIAACFGFGNNVEQAACQVLPACDLARQNPDEMPSVCSGLAVVVADFQANLVYHVLNQIVRVQRCGNVPDFVSQPDQKCRINVSCAAGGQPRFSTQGALAHFGE